MRRVAAVGALAVLLITPLAAAGPWLQPRGDAAATGFQPDGGPEKPDVALRVDLPGSMKPEADAPPLFLEDRILFLARPYGNPDDTDYRVFSVAIDTGNVTTVAEGIDVASRVSMAADGETVYVTSGPDIHAFPLEDGGNEWTWTGVGEARAPYTGQEDYRVEWCNRMALQPANLTVLCHAERVDQRPYDYLPAQSGSSLGNVVVARLDTETGEELWNWTVPRDPRIRPSAAPGGGGSWPDGLAVTGNRVVVQTTEGGVSCNDCSGDQAVSYLTGEFNSDLWGLHAETGELDWHQRLQSANQTTVWVAGQRVSPEDESYGPEGNPSIGDGAVYAKAGEVHKLNLGDGSVLWSQPIGEQDVNPEAGGGTGVGLTSGSAFTTTAQTLYRIDKDQPEDGWSTSLDFGADEGFQEEPVTSPSAIYSATLEPEGPDAVYAFDRSDGSVLWKHPTEGSINAFSVGQGLLAYTDVLFDGEDSATTTLVLLGETEASPDPAPSVSTTYPDQGQPVRVDLSDSGAGLQGTVTRYKADWGDGTTTGWQEDPVLTHSYNASGDRTARFVVANDVNQTASTTETFHVGEDPPPDPNFAQEAAQTALADGNVDITFGVLGIVMALTGGAVGVARRRRKRSRLQDELDAIERAYEETKHNPIECEAQLTERKTHARGLLLDGELDESQFQVVENRVEELLTELRRRSLDDEFDFLPHGLVKRGREMLEDGKVSSLEADAFLRAVEEAEMLSAEQKAVVRERIEEWRGRDAGGGGAA